MLAYRANNSDQVEEKRHMIIEKSLYLYPNLWHFLKATKRSQLDDCYNDLNPQKKYYVEQTPPDEKYIFLDLTSIIAAFGTIMHLSYIFQKTPPAHLNALCIIAIKQCKNEIFNFLFNYQTQQNTPTQKDHCTKILSERQQASAPTTENYYTELLEAAAVSNNIEILTILLDMDDSGYAALGYQGVSAPKYTPLYFAAISNSMNTFKRLLLEPAVREQFPKIYHQFCQSLAPFSISNELQTELDQLKPSVSPSLKLPRPHCSFYISSEKLTPIPTPRQNSRANLNQIKKETEDKETGTEEDNDDEFSAAKIDNLTF